VIKSVRLLGPEVAVIYSSQVTAGQINYKTHKKVADLHTNELTVLKKQGGAWVIVSDLASDEAHAI
jgi:hypothetical protein